MKIDLLQLKVVALFTIINLIIVNNLSAQYVREINLIPYSAGTREDSLKVLEKRISSIVEARRVFETAFQNKKIIYYPAPHYFFEIKSFLVSDDIRDAIFHKDRKQIKKYFRRGKAKLKRVVLKDNFFNFFKVLFLKLDFERNVATQQQIVKRDKALNFEVVLMSENEFSAIKRDVRLNKVKSISKSKEVQISLGIPVSVGGYVNSDNYRQRSLSHDSIPGFIRDLIHENIGISKRMIRDSTFLAMVQDVKYSLHDKDDRKLWVETNLQEKEIKISPYLIRAVFNQAYYFITLNKYIDQIVKPGEILGYLKRKTKMSVEELDSIYYRGFVDKFSSNMQFVIGHELAHLYLSQVEFSNIEVACDCYSSSNIKESGRYLDLGIFEKLLYFAIEDNDLQLWGRDVSIADIKHRYSLLKRSRNSKKLATECDKIIKEP